MRILVVEDEEAIAEALAHILTKNKYIVDTSYDGEDGYDNALSGIYDIIILDIMLPGMNGLDILKGIRKEGIICPVLLLTAKDEISDKVKGLDLGADDYLTKPFAMEELLARVRSLSRRTDRAISDNTLKYADISLNIGTYELSCGENSFKLGLKEYSIMEYLLNNPGKVISKEMLIEKIWGYDSDAEYNNVEVYISFIRKKLRHIHSAATIKTVRGVGYRLEES
ncbi:MAG: response regulator transcription factor [Clostridium sp.]|nr:response regulator transcription factor [Clostridium sp.]MCM1547410.1 response regulator transcription factor [Ruminococcus sp.]